MTNLEWLCGADVAMVVEILRDLRYGWSSATCDMCAYGSDDVACSSTYDCYRGVCEWLVSEHEEDKR